jgi:large subunit ribosomal protein L1
VGRVSFTPQQLVENAYELVSTLNKMKPSSAKGIYMKTISVASTMSPGIAVDPKSIKV